MKSFATVAALGAALALAGCGKSDDAGKTDDAGAAENAASVDAGAASGAIKRQAGNWKTQVTLVRFDMPGAPAIIKDQMAKQFASDGATETCVTQEQIEQEDVADAMSKYYGEGCTWAKPNIGGGKIGRANVRNPVTQAK